MIIHFFNLQCPKVSYTDAYSTSHRKNYHIYIYIFSYTATSIQFTRLLVNVMQFVFFFDAC